MTGSRADIARAEAQAAVARERIRVTLAQLKERVDPRVRAREAWEDVRERGEELGDDALEFAYERPALVASVAGAGVLLLLRRPILRFGRWLFRRRRSKWDHPQPPENPAGAAVPPPGQAGERR